MKRGTLDHPKLRRLARVLRINQAWAAGILEALWQHSRDYAPRGDVGRHDDIAIAEAVYWPTERDATELINALVECGWLDRHDEHRLVIHDWAEHCEDAVHAILARRLETFCDGTPARTGKLNAEERKRYHDFLAGKNRAAEPGLETGKPGSVAPVAADLSRNVGTRQPTLEPPMSAQSATADLNHPHKSAAADENGGESQPKVSSHSHSHSHSHSQGLAAAKDGGDVHSEPPPDEQVAEAIWGLRASLIAAGVPIEPPDGTMVRQFSNAMRDVRTFDEWVTARIVQPGRRDGFLARLRQARSAWGLLLTDAREYVGLRAAAG